MEIVSINSIEEYNAFIRGIYAADPYFKDNKTGLTELICGHKSAFRLNSRQEMRGVLRGGEMRCQAVFIRHKNQPEVLMIALFEAKEHADAEVGALVQYARELAVRYGCKKITAALDGHCNYSVGFITNGFDEPPRFGQAYNPPYYNDYFKNAGFTALGYTSYKDEIANINHKLFALAERLSDSAITLTRRNLTRGRFNESMRLYTKLNNEIFSGHGYYYKREEQEDMELFSAMRPMFAPESLIFAMKGTEPAGFILWYPDYNELAAPQAGVGYKTYIKHKILNRQPKTVIAVEIGVRAEYENTGLILVLFNELYNIVRERYGEATTVASSWIYNGNMKSTKLVSAILRHRSREFATYELEV